MTEKKKISDVKITPELEQYYEDVAKEDYGKIVPQPLTDEEVEELLKLHGNANSSPELEHRGYTRVDVDEDDAEFYKAAYSKVPFLVARIRADGRRMEAIRRIADDFIPDRDSEAPLALQEMRDALKAALEDKTK